MVVKRGLDLGVVVRRRGRALRTRDLEPARRARRRGGFRIDGTPPAIADAGLIPPRRDRPAMTLSEACGARSFSAVRPRLSARTYRGQRRPDFSLKSCSCPSKTKTKILFTFLRKPKILFKKKQKTKSVGQV